MPRLPRYLAAATLAGLFIAFRGRIARALRTADQRAGLFAPHGARAYNAVAPWLLRSFYVRVARDVSAAVEVLPQVSAVLEVGSGPGELALEIARRLPQSEVVGVDLAGAMVARAQQAATAAYVVDRVTFQIADAAALPFAAGTFDVAVSTLSLHHWSDPAVVFLELARVLRPGGVALIYDLRLFAYSTRELEVFLAGGPFEAAHVAWEPVASGLMGLFFVRIQLVRPVEP